MALLGMCTTPKLSLVFIFLLLLQQKTNTLVPWNAVYYHIAQEEKNVVNLPHFNSTWVKLTSHSSVCGYESTFRLLGSGPDSIQCGCRTDRAISHLHIGWSSRSPFKACMAWSSSGFQGMQKWNCTSCVLLIFFTFSSAALISATKFSPSKCFLCGIISPLRDLLP